MTVHTHFLASAKRITDGKAN